MFRRFARIALPAAFILVLAFSGGPASAQGLYDPPHFEIDGEIGLNFTDNALSSKTNRLNDGFIAPYLRFSYTGTTADGLSYWLYARQFSEFYFQQPGDNTLATFGGTLSRPVGPVVMGVQFDTKLFFDGFLANRTLTAYDTIGFVTRVIRFDNGLSAIAPRFTVAHRWADIATAERTWIEAKLSTEKHIADRRWYIVNILQVQYHWYLTAVGTVPRDIVPAATLGVKYRFNDDVALTLGATVQGRISNVAAREFTQWIVGPTLEFSHRF